MNDMPTEPNKYMNGYGKIDVFEEMRNVSKETIQLLDEHFVILHAKITESQKCWPHHKICFWPLRVLLKGFNPYQDRISLYIFSNG